MGADLGQSWVVADVKGGDSVKVDTVEVSQEGIGNDNALCRTDDRWEGKLAQSTESSPLDVSNRCELAEGEGGQLLDAIQLEGSSDALEGGRSNREQLGGIGGSEATSD